MAYENTNLIQPAANTSGVGATFTTAYIGGVPGAPLSGAGTTNVTLTGNLTLSAAQTLTSGFSAANGIAKFLLGYTLAGTALSTLSATTAGITLSVLKNDGTGTINGYIAGSSLNPNTSAASATIKFYDINYLSTAVVLSSIKTTTAVITGGAQNSIIDNPAVALIGPNFAPTTSVYNGLTSTGVNKFRTVSRQARLVQGEY